ncbi:MAG TPA: LuxR C-terminal-related transcriptional regulator, partial [Thermomicrobiales bacterium]
AIADEIERNLAFLATELRNVPARHRSMRAAFDHSWALLADEERPIFRQLAIFRGGFTREAAGRVAGAMLPLLSSLVDKSLVRRDADGRFSLHELLRQYAEEQLSRSPEESAQAAGAHRDYYLAHVVAQFGPMTGGGQREAVTAIMADLENVRVAWRSAAAVGDTAALGRAAHTLALFYDFRARYQEGLVALDEGLRALRAAPSSPTTERTLAAILVDEARFHHRLGQLPAMRAALDEAEARYARLDSPPPPGLSTDPLLWRGILALTDGHYAEAARLGAAAVRRNTDEDRPGNLSPAWWVRATAALWQEDFDTAGEYARRCTEAALAVGDRWYLAYGHNQQGHVGVARGDYAAARRHYTASYAIREELDDPEGMATGLAHLARVAELQGNRAEAEELYRRVLAIAREIGDQSAVANALNGLGMMACASGDYVVAGQQFAEGLRLMAAARLMRHLLALLTSAGDWLLRMARIEEAVAPLALASDHPASDHYTRERARRGLAAAGAALPPGALAVAIDIGRGAAPVELATSLAAILTMSPPTVAPEVTNKAAPLPAAAAPLDPEEALPEPLTARELEVLLLIAAGRSNREIADELFLAVNTVRSYCHQLFGKLGVGSRTQAVARARALGLLA